MKTVLFVPGFREDVETRQYGMTLEAIKKSGYKVVFVPIRWARTTIDDWVAELETEYKKHDPRTTVLAGFSYGAMTALVAASKRQPSELWLFSLSPYFSEDIPGLKLAWLRTIGKQRTERFRRIYFGKLSDIIKCKTLVFMGEKEAQKYPDLRKRCEEAVATIKTAELIVAVGAKHDVTAAGYIKAIQDNIRP